MTSARELLDRVAAEVAGGGGRNRLVDAVAAGRAPAAAIAALAAEESHIVPSDRRGFLMLAARSPESATTEFFTALAQGESLALTTLPSLAAAAGMDAAGLAAYEPRPGCQAYPGCLAWLALNADPAEAVLAVTANFAAWGAYCATLATALRERYGFDDRACGFVDLFATPAPQLEEQAVAAIQAGLDRGLRFTAAERYAHRLHAYELMFWGTLAAEWLPDAVHDTGSR